MAERYVSRREIAERLGLSERQITNLVRDAKLADGTEFPSRVKGKDRSFPSDRCFDWYVRFKQEEALQRAAGREAPKDMAAAELRKAIADAEIAELKVAQLRGEFVSLEEYRKELRRILTRIRARFVAIPGEFAPRILEPMDMVKASAVLKDLVATVLAELQGVGRHTEDASDEQVAA